MGQHEVYQYLKNNPEKWFTKEEISVGIDSNIPCVSRALTKMTRSNEVLEDTKINFNKFKIIKLYKFKK